MTGFDPQLFILIAGVALFAGFVKGAVGFALPMLMISGLSLFVPLDMALAVLILPTLVTNGAQALRQGMSAARDTLREFWIYLCVGGCFLLIGAQLVAILPKSVLFLAIGISVTGFSLAMLGGARIHILPHRRSRFEAAFASVAGLIGGMSGIWGPPTVVYLTALETPKQEQIRAQGVIYGLGATALLFAHLQTGIVSAETLPLSAFAILPAGLGLWIGFGLQDRLDQKLFRKLTLLVLIVAGLNLIRRGVFG